MAYRRNDHSRYRQQTRQRETNLTEQGFRCRHCSMEVSCAPHIAGVQNRNHCPYCLWSRHLDGVTAGDRRSACRATMRPVGLTTKRSHNKYARERDGELMLIHQCTVCAKLVINRIAADDSTPAILDLLENSCIPDGLFATRLAANNVALLTLGDRDLVRRQLLGSGATGVTHESVRSNLA
jgi:hypothetical protein